ncbi:MAG: DUF2254 domain-containing protein, partial [Myxococcales bacterium]|nr:DUF2254 domain-containing protein [Myxococcales bacterium]
LVLRSVHGADANGELEAFVPQLAVLLALLLAVLSVGVLIYFIHHVPATLSMSNLIQRVGDTLQDRIRCLYPTEIGEGQEEPEARAAERLGTPIETLRADDRIGYLCYVDEDALLGRAGACDLVVELIRRPGEFVSRGAPLANVYGTGKLDDDVRAALIAAFVTGPERTPRQDVLFPALELVEVAVRALSPGLNDPYTAVRCVDQLHAALVSFGQRELPVARRVDEHGRLRMVAAPVDFGRFCDTVFDGLRPHVARDANCAVHLLEAVAETLPQLPREADRAVLRRHAEALRAPAIASARDDRDRGRIAHAADRSGAVGVPAPA